MTRKVLIYTELDFKYKTVLYKMNPGYESSGGNTRY